MNDWVQYRALDSKLRGLERQQRQAAGSAQNWDSYQFKVSPTVPPSTSITFRGGLMYLPSSVGLGHGWYVDGYTVDLTNAAKVTTSTSFTYRTYTFSNAYWYAGCLVVLRLGLNPDTWGLHPAIFPDQGIILAGTMPGTSEAWEEFATAEEAEQALADMTMERANSGGMPMAALVMRNNGDTANPLQFMAVDQVNRARSYYLWDVRQAWQIE